MEFLRSKETNEVTFTSQEAKLDTIEVNKLSSLRKMIKSYFPFEESKLINEYHTSSYLISFYSLMAYLSNIINQYDSTMTEINYRLKKNFTQTELNELSQAKKFQLIGKIGSKPTEFDAIAYSSNSLLYYNKKKICLKKKDQFPSCRANNCLVSGKWVYEAVILSNGLMQIGYGQLLTQNTEFWGIGDDATSFALDGFRKLIYNEKFYSYGKIWDVGDVIGVCIDMNSKQLEFFLNGKSLGLTRKGKVQCGQNIAYFPAISGQTDEKACFNFGEHPFYYSYQGYEPIDLPKSSYNNNLHITSKLINLLDSPLLDLLSKGEDTLSLIESRALNKMVFSYLVNVSFTDLFICKALLFPFLTELFKRDEPKFNSFLNQIQYYYRMNDTPQRRKFYSNLKAKLFNLVEEYALVGKSKIKDYEILLVLIIALVRNSYIFKKWLNSSTMSFHLSLLFNSKTVHMNAIYEAIIASCQAKQLSKGKLLKHLIKSPSFLPEESAKNEETYSSAITQFLFSFISMSKKEKMLPRCFTILFRTMKGYYNLNLLNETKIEEFTSSEANTNVNLIKNFIFNYMQMFLDNFSSLPFKKMDEDRFVSNIFKSILLMIPMVEDFLTQFHLYYKKAKITPGVKWEITLNNTTEELNYLYRNFFHLFNENVQRILFNFSFYLSQYLIYRNRLAPLDFSENKIHFPAIIAKFLWRYHSKTVRDSSRSRSLSLNCSHFSNTSYYESILLLYSELFSQNSNERNQIIIIMKAINFFISKAHFTRAMLGNKEISEKIIKGICFYFPKFSQDVTLFLKMVGRIMDFSNREYLLHFNQSVKALSEEMALGIADCSLKHFHEKLIRFELVITMKGQTDKKHIELIKHKTRYTSLCKALNLYSFAIMLTFSAPLVKSPKSMLFLQNFQHLLKELTAKLLNKHMIGLINTMNQKYLKYYDRPYGLSLLKMLHALCGLFNLYNFSEEMLTEVVEVIANDTEIKLKDLKKLIIFYLDKKEENDMGSLNELNQLNDFIQRIEEKREPSKKAISLFKK